MMRVVETWRIDEFGKQYPDAGRRLQAWLEDARRATWTKPTDITAVYRNASILHNRRVVFNICGNKYRLVVRVQYQLGIIDIRFIGTHGEYDEIDAHTV